MATSLAKRQVPQSAVFCVTIALVFLGLAAFTFLQYLVPPSFRSIMGGDYKGFPFYARQLGIYLRPCSVANYVGGFRVILIALVCLHLTATRAAISLDPKYFKTILVAVVAANLFFAIFYPPAQSNDTFNYTAVARMLAYYKLNPYTHNSLVLVHRHDEVAPYLNLVFRDLYGPLWTLLSSGMTVILRGPGLFAQIITYKLIEAVCLTLAAVSASNFCRRRSVSYGFGALVGIGLNPLCLLEGPGNGHNDILMMWLAMVALDLYDRKKSEASSLFAGLSAAIKFVPYFLLPWICIDILQQRINLLNRRTALVVCGLVLPFVLLFVPFWQHGTALNALLQRTQGQREVLIVKEKDQTEVFVSTHRHAVNWNEILSSEGGGLFLYVSLTLIFLMRKRLLTVPQVRQVVQLLMGDSGYPAWVVIWILQATLQRYVLHSLWYSWYYTWSIFPAACIWTKRGNPLFIATMSMALVDTLFYTF
jgi:hypothetical protein